MKAAKPEGHRAKKGLLAQGLTPQQQLLQGEGCPTTTAERRIGQDLPTKRAGDQRFRLAWTRWSTFSAVKLEIHFSQVQPHATVVGVV